MSKQYSFDDIKKHYDNQSCWIVIHNNVYDVTPFLNEHPGGEEVLLEQASKDASESFEDVGHSSDARELMEKYKIGELIESERKLTKEKVLDWSNTAEESNNSSSFKSWILPITIGIFATLIYRFYLQS